MAINVHLTPGIVLLDEHYRNLGLHQGWNNEQLNRLCAMYQCTPHEMGRLCCVYPAMRKVGYMRDKRPRCGVMQKMIDRDHFPPHVALHFAILERCFLESTHGVISEPIMPVDLITKGKQNEETNMSVNGGAGVVRVGG